MKYVCRELNINVSQIHSGESCGLSVQCKQRVKLDELLK